MHALRLPIWIKVDSWYIHRVKFVLHISHPVRLRYMGWSEQKWYWCNFAVWIINGCCVLHIFARASSSSRKQTRWTTTKLSTASQAHWRSGLILHPGKYLTQKIKRSSWDKSKKFILSHIKVSKICLGPFLKKWIFLGVTWWCWICSQGSQCPCPDTTCSRYCYYIVIVFCRYCRYLQMSLISVLGSR